MIVLCILTGWGNGQKVNLTNAGGKGMRQKKIIDSKLLAMLKEGKTQKQIAEYFKVSPVAICKRVKRLLPPPDLDKYGLTDKEKAFVVEKAKGKTNTQAALASYEVTSLDSAKNIGSQLMSKPEVQMAIDELMEFHNIGRSFRISRLAQHINHNDPVVSLKALDLSWKLDGSYAPEKSMNISIDYNATSKRIEELEKELEKLEADND